MNKTTSDSTCRHNRAICIPFCPQDYNKIVCNFVKFRETLDAIIEQFPELFPAEIETGYLIKDIRESKKLSIPIRRIKISGVSYTIRPSFVMPYMTGMVKDKARLFSKNCQHRRLVIHPKCMENTLSLCFSDRLFLAYLYQDSRSLKKEIQGYL